MKILARIADEWRAWRIRRAIARLTPAEKRRLMFLLQQAIGECDRLLDRKANA
jgi:hypothetical protein